jgi:dephospho-CoA kinase
LTRIVALTGNIGSGKSTVARLLEERGAYCIRTDEVARKVVEPGTPAYQEIVQAFGRGVLTSDGTLDRTALGRIVFQDEGKRRLLERITHPRIMEEVARLVAEGTQRGVRVIIIEIPLLFETGMDKGFPDVILVTAPESVRFQRIMERDSLDPEEVARRIQSQIPEKIKIPKARWVIENSGSLEDLKRKVDELWQELVR